MDEPMAEANAEAIQQDEGEIRSHSRDSSIAEDELLDDPGDGVDSEFDPGSSSSLPSFNSDEDSDFSDNEGKRPGKVFRQGERQSNRVAALQQKQDVEQHESRAARRLPAVKQQQQKSVKSVKSEDSEGEEGGTESSISESDDEPEQVLERQINEEEAHAHMAACRQMPEMACIVEFLFRFRHTLELRTVITFQSLVDALVRSPGPGMLASLHTELLQGITSSKNLSEQTWPILFAQRLAYVWQSLSRAQNGPAPFKPDKGEEAKAYAALPSQERVKLLALLCDLRAERDDIREEVEEAAAPPKKGRKDKEDDKAPARPTRARQQEPQPLTEADVRRKPLGVDASGWSYWWLDWCEEGVEGGTDYGFLLAREGPATWPKSDPTSPAPAQPGSAPSTSKPEEGGKQGAAGRGGKGKSGPQPEQAEAVKEEVQEADAKVEVQASGKAAPKAGGKAAAGKAGKSGSKQEAKQEQAEEAEPSPAAAPSTAQEEVAAPAADASGKRRSGRGATAAASNASQAAAQARAGRGKGAKAAPKGKQQGEGEGEGKEAGGCKAGNGGTEQGAAGKAGSGAKGKESKGGSKQAGGKAQGGKAEPAKAKAGKGAKGGGKAGKQAPKPNLWETYKLPPAAVPGRWEVVGASVGELEAFGAKLGRSLKAADKAVADKISRELVPQLHARIEQSERWARAREKMAKALSSAWGAGMSLGSRRARKEVDYTGEKFDKAIRAGIRAGEVSTERTRGRGSQSREGSAQPPLAPAARAARNRNGSELVELDMGAPRSRPPRAPAAAKPGGKRGASEGGEDDAQQGGSPGEPGSGSGDEAGPQPAKRAKQEGDHAASHDAERDSMQGAQHGDAHPAQGDDVMADGVQT